MVREALANGRESLSLATIARRVFRRGEDFDARLDPAVRIEVGRLRRALERYYGRAGAEDPVCISRPRGACVPIARWTPGRAREARDRVDLEASAPVSRP
jgi:hypothetical protein